MESIFVAIVTGNAEYGRSLSLGILSVCRSFIIRIYSMEEFASEERKFDIVLWDGETRSEDTEDKIIYLVEKPSDVAKNASQKKFCIYKYCAAASMVAALFEIYEKLTGRCAVNLKRQNVRLFAFTSAVGGAGCTTMAMATAQEFCRFQGKRVMYLSFEEFESTGEYVKSEDGIKGAAAYLYNLFNKMYFEDKAIEKRSSSPFVEGHIVRDDFGIEAFAPSCGRNPLRVLNTEELDRFISSLIDSCRYDVIIMDLGQWMSTTALECLEMAEKICFVAAEQADSVRERQHTDHLLCNCGETAIDKTIRVINKGSTAYYAYETEKEGIVQDGYMKISRGKAFTGEGKRIRIALEGEFGRQIAALCEKLTEPL